jgi:hypothetical protein
VLCYRLFDQSAKGYTQQEIYPGNYLGFYGLGYGRNHCVGEVFFLDSQTIPTT